MTVVEIGEESDIVFRSKDTRILRGGNPEDWWVAVHQCDVCGVW